MIVLCVFVLSEYFNMNVRHCMMIYHILSNSLVMAVQKDYMAGRYKQK